MQLPEVADALLWFDATHSLVRDQGIPYWQRVSLPTGGGAGEQDALLMAQLDWLLQVHASILKRDVDEQLKKARATAEAEAATSHGG